MFKRVAVWFTAGMILSAHAVAGEYRLGQGVQVGELPLYLGGYLSVDHASSEERQKFRIDDIALLGYGAHGRWSYMTEIEAKEVYTYDDGTAPKEDSNWDFKIERLYVNYEFDDTYALRIGKYNSPVGFWNLVPVNVLRPTTSNPYVAKAIYPKFTTGLLGSAHLGESLAVDVMLQDLDDDFESRYNNFETTQHAGLGIAGEFESLTLKCNGGYFELEEEALAGELYEHYYYAVAALGWELENISVTSEIGRRWSDSAVEIPYGAYLQGVWQVAEHHEVIGRVEGFEQNNPDGTTVDDVIGIAGYTYRPVYPIAIKGEYQSHRYSDNNQWLFSFSVIF